MLQPFDISCPQRKRPKNRWLGLNLPWTNLGHLHTKFGSYSLWPVNEIILELFWLTNLGESTRLNRSPHPLHICRFNSCAWLDSPELLDSMTFGVMKAWHCSRSTDRLHTSLTVGSKRPLTHVPVGENFACYSGHHHVCGLSVFFRLDFFFSENFQNFRFVRSYDWKSI